MPISFARHRFSSAVVRHAVWLYLRFTLSFRDVEDLLAERGVDVSYETVRRWVIKFGPLLARELRCRRARPTRCWHLDEMVVTIAGKRHWLWRAVDSEGEVLDMLVQSRRDTAAAVRLLRKLLRKQGFTPDIIVTDRLRSYGAGLRQLGLSACHEQGQRKKQSRRELAPARETTRAQDATVQIARISATLLVLPRCSPQHFRPPATSDLAPDFPPVSGRSDEHVAGCDRCLSCLTCENGKPLFNHRRLT